MSRKENVSDIKQIFNSYDRYLISDSVFNCPNSLQIATELIQKLPVGSAYITPKSRQVAEKSGNSGGKSALNLLVSKGIIKGEINTTFEDATKKVIAAALKQGKSMKLLLITQDESEGYEYERMDYEDNHLNDIDAVGFDSGRWVKYVYEAPKEEFFFKFACIKQVPSSLKIVFHKTTGLKKMIVQDPHNPTSECLLHAKNGMHMYSYKTYKDVLFEADKFEVIGVFNGQTLKSKLYDFYIGETQHWILEVVGQEIVCTFHTGDKKPKETPAPETTTAPQEEEVGSGGTYKQRLYSRESVPPNEIATDAFFGRTVDPRIKSSDVLIPIAQVPKTGSVLYLSNGKTIKVGEFIGDGGEGIVYKTQYDDTVVKIYHKNKLTKLRQKKIEKMTSLNIGKNNPNIIWPMDSVYTKENIFVGFTMKFAKGITLYSFFSQLPNKKRDKIGIFDITKTQLVEMIISLLDSIAYLHARNILIRDLKLPNIKIDPSKPTQCMLVDCDSFQIGEYVAPVFSPEHIPPEAYGVDASSVYQTKSADVFTLFIVLMRMLVNKNSNVYGAVNSDKNGNERCREGLFPYSMIQSKTIASSYGPYTWSHLPSYIKEAFISVGDRMGSRYDKNKRLSAEEWLKLFLAYHKDLKAGPTGRLGKNDKDYNVSYPLTMIEYSLVNLKLVSTVKGEMKDFSLTRIVKRILNKANLRINENEILDSLRKTGRYKKEGQLAIMVIKDVGILSYVRYAYSEI